MSDTEFEDHAESSAGAGDTDAAPMALVPLVQAAHWTQPPFLHGPIRLS